MTAPGALRIALTLPGAVSLGAYEAGALAALLVGVQEVNRLDAEALRVDAIAGASAGSITGVLAARTLLEGQDPVTVMHGLWVAAPALRRMHSWRLRAPLSVRALREESTRLLALPGRRTVAQRTGVKLNMALGALRGIEYSLGRVGGPALAGTTYLDWADCDLEPGAPAESYAEPIEAGATAFAEASGASAAAFPPVRINRGGERRRYEDNRVTNFPPSGWFWYTDGGTLDNEPLGRALDMSNALDLDTPDPRRLHLVISPTPETPARADDDWSDQRRQPSWTQVGARTLELIKAQNLYDDLRQLEKTNSRVAWLKQVEETLNVVLSSRGEVDAAEELRATADSIERQKQQLHDPVSVREDTYPRPNTEIAHELRRALALATGLGGKRDVEADIVSPLLLPEVRGGRPVAEVLSGDYLAHFGGFLDERYRSSDFAAGYRSMLEWLCHPQRGLAARGLSAQLASAASRAAGSRYADGWETGTAGSSRAQLGLAGRLELLIVGLRAALIATLDLRRRAARARQRAARLGR